MTFGRAAIAPAPRAAAAPDRVGAFRAARRPTSDGLRRVDSHTPSEGVDAGGLRDARPADRPDARRRRLAGLLLLLQPVSLAAVIGGPLCADAAGAPLPIPGLVSSLDGAASALFDAAETADWSEAETALAQANAAASRVGELQRSFVDRGGDESRFIEVQNNLGADLIEAGTALSIRDQRWLINSADRVQSRAGELSQPFVGRGDALSVQIETLLFLARRMRRARVWHDERGYRQAFEAFGRIASSLHGELDQRSSTATRALDLALRRLGEAPSSADLRSLDEAVRGLRGVAPCTADCPT